MSTTTKRQRRRSKWMALAVIYFMFNAVTGEYYDLSGDGFVMPISLEPMELIDVIFVN